MNLLEEVTNLLSLALRVFGNIFCRGSDGKYVSPTFSSGLLLVPYCFGTNLIWTAFSVFISCVQAYVFTLLSSNVPRK